MSLFDQFRSSAPLRSEMATLLENPTMKLAIQAIREKSEPKVIPDPIQGLHPDSRVAQEFYRLHGICKTLDWFTQLTTAPREHEQEVEPWIATLPQEMQDGIKKLRSQALAQQ